MSQSFVTETAVCRAKAAWSATITKNERAWIEFIRLVTDDSDPSPTLHLVQELRKVFSTERVSDRKRVIGSAQPVVI